MTSIDYNQILKDKRFSLFFKRIFDIVCSLIGLIIMLIPMIIIAITIKIGSNGPVLFKQVRVGRNNQDFKILKFRTMVVDAEKQGMQLTVGRDRRITKVGSFLRRTKLDEFPQLINVLKGEMSFVGPRPEVRKYVELYTEEQRNVLRIRPGITDLASVTYKDESTLLGQSDDPEKTYINVIMPEKLRLNLEYIRKFSILYDIKMILKTLSEIIRDD